MRLSKIEIKALANKIINTLVEQQDAEIAKKYQEYKQSAEYQDDLNCYLDLVSYLKEFNSHFPESQRIKKVEFMNYSAIQADISNDDLEMHLERNFRRHHTKMLPSTSTIENELICECIGVSTVEVLISTVMAKFEHNLTK